MTVKVTFDTRGFTLQEQVDFKRIAGFSIRDIAGLNESEIGKRLTADEPLLALAYIAGRRQDPTFTLEQAGSLYNDDLEWETPDPTTESGTDS